jgi:pSer/pThr/pTyr-binding forkhead associated (FHA) protein
MPNDTFVSQLHARVFREAGSTMIEDLGSTNGTYLNGKRLATPERVSKGDRVQIGNTVFEAE